MQEYDNIHITQLAKHSAERAHTNSTADLRAMNRAQNEHIALQTYISVIKTRKRLYVAIEYSWRLQINGRCGLAQHGIVDS